MSARLAARAHLALSPASAARSPLAKPSITARRSVTCRKAIKISCSSQPTETNRRSWVGESSQKAASDPRRVAETEGEARSRRMKESREVEARMTDVYCKREFLEVLEQAGNRLVVLEVESNDQCEMDLDEMPTEEWELTHEEKLEPCRKLRGTLARCARDCPDIQFVSLLGDESLEAKELCEYLKIDVMPTIQFYRNKELLWETRGHNDAQADLGEGVLYFGDYFAEGQRASSTVREIEGGSADFEDFIRNGPTDELAIVDVSMELCSPCIHVFPAVLSLSKTMQGQVRFARLLGDMNEQNKQLAKSLNITQVPTFLFFKNGQPIHRFVGSSRGDLIGQILQQQNVFNRR